MFNFPRQRTANERVRQNVILNNNISKFDESQSSRQTSSPTVMLPPRSSLPAASAIRNRTLVLPSMSSSAAPTTIKQSSSSSTDPGSRDREIGQRRQRQEQSRCVKEELDLNAKDKKELNAAEARDKWFLEEGLNFGDKQDRIIMLSFCGIKASSLRGAVSHYRALKRHGYPISHEGVMEMFANHPDEIKSESVSHWLWAVNVYRECYGHAHTAEENACRRRVELLSSARRLMGQEPRSVPRGAVEDKMLEDLVSKVSSIPQEYKVFFVFLQAFGIRISQLLDVRLGDVKLLGGDSYELAVQRSSKGRKILTTEKGPVDEKHINRGPWITIIRKRVQEVTAKAIARRQAGVRMSAAEQMSGPLLFEEYDYTKGCECIKDAQKQLGWSDKLNWVVHCTRHGPATETRRVALDNGLTEFEALEQVQEVTKHKTQAMATHYSRSNATREAESANHTRSDTTSKYLESLRLARSKIPMTKIPLEQHHSKVVGIQMEKRLSRNETF